MSLIDIVKTFKEKLDGIDEAHEYVRWADRQLAEIASVLKILQKNGGRIRKAFDEVDEKRDLDFINSLITEIFGLRLSVKDRLVKVSRTADKFLARIAKRGGKDADVQMSREVIQKVKSASDRALSEWSDVLQSIDRLQAWVRKERAAAAGGIVVGILTAAAAGIGVRLLTGLLTGTMSVEGLVAGASRFVTNAGNEISRAVGGIQAQRQEVSQLARQLEAKEDKLRRRGFALKTEWQPGTSSEVVRQEMEIYGRYLDNAERWVDQAERAIGEGHGMADAPPIASPTRYLRAVADPTELSDRLHELRREMTARSR